MCEFSLHLLVDRAWTCRGKIVGVPALRPPMGVKSILRIGFLVSAKRFPQPVLSGFSIEYWL